MINYLKFESEDQATTTFISLGWVTEPFEDYEGGEVLMAGEGYEIDYVGTLNTGTGNILTLDTGEEYEEMVELDGFHVNLLMKIVMPTELNPFLIFPNTPNRRFA